MQITNKAEPDPVSGFKMVDAYLRWALIAAEEVAGKQGLAIVLREAGLEQLINNTPANDLKSSGSYTFGHYARFHAALHNFFGRGAKNMVLRIGRLSARQGIEQQSALFGIAALVASKTLSYPNQVKLGLEAMRDGLTKVYALGGQKVKIRVEDRDDQLTYIDYQCANCAGHQSDAPMCWIHVGVIQEAIRWQTGREADVVQVACRAMGHAACEWNVSKAPRE